MKRIVVFDIETIPDLSPELHDRMASALKPRKGTKDEAKILAQLAEKRTAIAEGAALSPLTGQVCAIGLAHRERRDDGAVAWELDCLTAEEGGEAALLCECAGYLDGVDAFFVGFNSRSFDLPFLAARAALNGVKFSPRFPSPADWRAHLDLMDFFPGKLDHWAYRVLGEGKSGDGSDVTQLVIEGRWQELAAYCANDVRLTCALYDLIAPVIHH